MKEFLTFFSFHSCSRAGIFKSLPCFFSPSQDSESHQTTSRQWLCRSPCGPPCEGLLAPASRQPLPAPPPPCRQAGKQVPASRRPHCQQACSAQQRAGSQAPVPGGGSTWQACPAQQQAGSQAPVSSSPCVSRLALHSSGRAARFQ